MTQTLGASPALSEAQLSRLQAAFGGEIVTPTDEGYHEATRLWNAIHDRRPAVLVRPRSSDEVATVIRFARDHDLELAIRSGGHSAAGHSSCDGGLVLDLSGMRGVTVDPGVRTARANGGALLGELDVAAQAHGLVCPIGVIGHTGVAGLTLGGGVGRLQRQFGLTIDNLRAVELVTADGRLVRASATDEPDLFWGMRGAGWNFGVATAFEFDLRPFGPDLHRGLRTYPATAAREVWEVFRDYAATAPDAVSVIYGIGRLEAGEGGEAADDQVTPTSRDPVVFVSFNHSGRADAVEADTAGLRRGPEPLSVSAGSQPYLEVQTAHDLVLGWGRRSFIKGLYADDLRPEALDAVVEQVTVGPAEGSFSVTVQRGAISRVDEAATAFTGRAARFDLSADSAWDDAAEDEANRGWVRATMALVEPDAIGGRYANENADVGPEETRAIYGDAKVARLAGLKRTWDPDNVFRLNHNVAPAVG
ncbi:MAG TPA: FAD-binding oxidoreductase [Candidatus Limnocylindrales bacterium]|nr:FAD-binding oxidoreductase [Candidatus Limnocylindrales bacterium]